MGVPSIWGEALVRIVGLSLTPVLPTPVTHLFLGAWDNLLGICYPGRKSELLTTPGIVQGLGMAGFSMKWDSPS